MAKRISAMILVVAILALPLSAGAGPVPFTETPMYKYLCEIGRQKSPTYNRQLQKLQKQPQKQSQKQPKDTTDTVPPEKPYKLIFEITRRPMRREDFKPISSLTPDTTFAQAIDILRHSVRPPLNIVVFWKDLQEYADIDRDSPIGIEAPSAVTLRTHLELILTSISATADTELSYVVEDGIVKIATKDFLPKIMKTRVYDITDLTAPPARFFDYAGPYMFRQNRYGSGTGLGFGGDYGYGGYPSRPGQGYRYGSRFNNYRSYPYGLGRTYGTGLSFY